MGLCQQRQYTHSYKSNKLDLQNNLPKDKAHVDFNLFIKQNNKKQIEKDRKLTKFFEDQNRKNKQQDRKLQKYFQDQAQKKLQSDKKFVQSLKKMEMKRKLQPYQTQMAKVLYAYMRLYGHNPDEQTRKFIQQNYNDSYCSKTYKLDQSTPTYTYKYEVIKRLQTAHEKRLISDHQRFIKADEINKTIEYDWTIRHQLTNHRTVYDCKATFDEKNRLLSLTLKQLDRYNYKPAPPSIQPEKPYKHAWQKNENNYYAPSTDWGAYYNAQIQRSNDQFRQNMNKQAQQWNNYAQQKNTRGW